MSLVNVAALLGGIGLYGLIMWDVVKTTISLHGGGPLTQRIMRWVGKLVDWSENSDAEGMSTPQGWLAGHSLLVLTLTLFAVWFTGLLLSMAIVLTADPTSILDSSKVGESPSFVDRLYFVGASLTTAGFGPFRPAGVYWQLVTVAVAVSGLVVSSLGISYVISLVSAVLQQRKLAREISNLGATPREVLSYHFSQGSFTGFSEWGSTLAEQLIGHSAQHLAYPVIHFVRAIDRRDSVPVAVACLDETLSILLFEVPKHAQPPLHQLVVLRRAITTYLASAQTQFVDTLPTEPAWPDSSWMFDDFGLQQTQLVDQLAPPERAALSHRRRLLRALVESANVSWENVPERLTRGSEQSLDANIVEL